MLRRRRALANLHLRARARGAPLNAVCSRFRRRKSAARACANVRVQNLQPDKEHLRSAVRRHARRRDMWALIRENLLAPTTTIGPRVRFLLILCLKFAINDRFQLEQNAATIAWPRYEELSDEQASEAF